MTFENVIFLFIASGYKRRVTCERLSADTRTDLRAGASHLEGPRAAFVACEFVNARESYF